LQLKLLERLLLAVELRLVLHHALQTTHLRGEVDLLPCALPHLE
jgi:hypothetical protein